MTDERMALIELIEQDADTDLVREMLSFAAKRLMEAEVEARTGAGHGLRDPARQVQRNGYRGRAWIRARAGSILRSPGYARVAIFPLSWGRDAPPRRRSPPSSKKLTCTASRHDRWMIWSRRWEPLASPRAKSAAWSRRSTAG